MEISRREFLRLLGGAGSGTALSGLIASGVSLAPIVARAQQLRIKDARTTPSVCPYCSVGCATLVHTTDGQIVNIEGDPRSPHNEGTLCHKGAATFQLHVNPNRPTKVLHRAPGAADCASCMSASLAIAERISRETCICERPTRSAMALCVRSSWM